jgi:hypothetical protein
MIHSVDIIGNLIQNLENKAKYYKKAVPQSIFLLNNFGYVLKALKVSQLSRVSTLEIEQDLKGRLDKQAEILLANWAILCDLYLTTGPLSGDKLKEKIKVMPPD